MKKIFLFFALFACFACDENVRQIDIPYVPFNDIYINLNLPQYKDLSIDGGYYDGLSQGVRGIILYRLSPMEYKAFERVCAYHPNEACATISVHSSGLYMQCPCCKSSYSFENGYPTGGPSQFPLRQYEVTYIDRKLTITDEEVY